MSDTTSAQSEDQKKSEPREIHHDEWLAELDRIAKLAQETEDGWASVRELIKAAGGDVYSESEKRRMLIKMHRAVDAGKMECRSGKRKRIDGLMSPVPVYRWIGR